jgi:hypothetical protein|nr:MAG TPA: hypothetical protein [Caudoviricetes sp.]
MEYGYHVVHYAAPTIDMYIVEQAGSHPVANYQRLGEVFYDGTESMCRDFLDDLRDEIGGDRISSYGRESLVVTCGWGANPGRRDGITYHSSAGIDTQTHC